MADPITPTPDLLGTGGAARAGHAISTGGALGRVRRAEDQAVGVTPVPVQAPVAPAPTTPAVGGPAPSADLMARLKAQQDARNAEVLAKAMAARQGIPPAGQTAPLTTPGYGAVRR